MEIIRTTTDPLPVHNLRLARIDKRSDSPQSRRRCMNIIRKTFPLGRSLACLGIAIMLGWLTQPLAATESAPAANPTASEQPAQPTSPETNEALRASLALQEQVHAAQMALQKNREEQAALEKEVASRLRVLEEVVTTQRSEELEAVKARVETLRKDLDSNNRLLLYVGGGIAAIGFFVLLATGYLQWRSVNRLAEFSALVQSARATLPAPGVTVGEGNLLGAATTAQANGKLFGALTDLEKRIAELEHTTHIAPEAKVLTTATGTSGNETEVFGENGRHTGGAESELLIRGQSLLEADKAREALACFDEILATEPNHGEALVKKGLALEALQQPEEALRCYDRAIAANADLTIAYLQKGGLFNRLERYEEALQCYELALRAQEKAHQA